MKNHLRRRLTTIVQTSRLVRLLDQRFPNKLSPPQAQAALLIALGRRQREVAKLVGVSAETVSRWWHIAEFESAVSDNQRQFIDYTRARHMFLVGKAVDRLEQLLDSSNPVIKLRAIQIVLQPLKITAPLPHVELERGDEADFQEFVRVFTEASNSTRQIDRAFSG
jgi:transcriptional regulator with XRE-family HTH domain